MRPSLRRKSDFFCSEPERDDWREWYVRVVLANKLARMAWAMMATGALHLSGLVEGLTRSRQYPGVM